MNKTLLLICGFLCFSFFTSCKKESVASSPVTKHQSKRTVLTYLFQDTNLWEELTVNINDMELGWDPTTDGTMLVYVDASTRMTQFGNKPVLLEIQHDTTNLIVSKVVKVYSDADATNTEVFFQVQQDAIEMYPAESYGLVFSCHGNGFFVNKPENTKGLSGSERWSENSLNIDVIAKNTATHYDFIIFDACLMGESTSLYQLRNVTDFVVASVELSAGDGFGFRTAINALYTQPKADLYSFCVGSMDYYNNTERGQKSINPDDYLTIGVYRMTAMEKLAAVTKKVIEKININYSDLETEIKSFIGTTGIKKSMFYPQGDAIEDVMYYDMGLLTMLLKNMNEKVLATELEDAIYGVVVQSQYAFSKGFLKDNKKYKRLSANISFYIPTLNSEYDYQDEAFYNRFEWSAASGFTDKWK